MDEILLKNGTREVRLLVIATMFSLQTILKKHPIAFYQLVMKCRNPAHQYWPGMEEILRSFYIIEADGTVHGSVRNIVLSAVEGEGLKLVLKSPLAES